MPLPVSRTKALVFTAVILVFFLIMAEFICTWEEDLQKVIKPSLLEYQQTPDAFFKRQNLIGHSQAWRAVGLTWAYQSVPIEKPKDEMRIGVLGASATAGFGYSQTWSFPGILQRLCDAAGKNVQVINLSRIGYASRQLQTLAFEAVNNLALDHLIVYAGNNEFLEVNARLSTGANLEDQTAKAHGLFSKSALYRFLHRWIFRATKKTATLKDEAPIPTQLPPGVRSVIKAEYIENLSNIAKIAKGKCDMTLCTVAANLMFGPTGKEPFCLSPEGDEKWRYLQMAMAYEKLGRLEKARRAWQKAVEVAPESEKEVILLWGKDPNAGETAEKILQRWGEKTSTTPLEPELFALAMAAHLKNKPEALSTHFAGYLREHAGTYLGEYWLGRLAFLKGDVQTAKNQLSAARNLDIRRISVPSDFNVALRQLAALKKIRLVDVERAGLWNYDHFNDNCHFNLDGNLAVASLIYRSLFDEQPPDVGTPQRWLADREDDFLVPWYWMGQDSEIWKVYQVRPGSIHDQNAGPLESDSLREKFRRTNRLFFTWAGANQSQFSEMEAGYTAGMQDADLATIAKQCLQYLYRSEGMKKQAEQFGDFPSPTPFPFN